MQLPEINTVISNSKEPISKLERLTFDKKIVARILNWIFVKHNFSFKILRRNLHKNIL